MKKYFGMAALLLALAACSKVETPVQPVEELLVNAEEITITATLPPKIGGTKAVFDNGDNKITVNWAVDEHMAILYEAGGVKKRADARITEVDTDGSATIEFRVEGAENNTPCTIVYPLSAAKDDNSGVKDAATLLAEQNGKLNANLDVRVGEGTICISKPNLSITTQPAAQFAIFKFTVRELNGYSAINVLPLIVTIGGQNYTITPTYATDVLYAALPAVSNEKVTFFTEDWHKTYVFSSRANFAAGKYYPVTLKMRECVDLGTTISVGGVTKKLLWATCNVGADNPWDYGDYFAWGETSGKQRFNWGNYVFGQATSLTKYTGSDYSTLLPADDAATANWGGNWRMPTVEELQLLFGDDFSKKWTDDYLGDSTNHKGFVVRRTRGEGAGNEIFLPANGYGLEFGIQFKGTQGNYWGSSYDTSDNFNFIKNAAGLGIVNKKLSVNYGERCYGCAVRPVIEL